MNQTSKSLNDLFRSAINETEGNVLSQSEVERLLRNSNVRSVPVTRGARMYRALFSTPFKTGMTAMTTLASIALALLTFWPQTPPPQRAATVPLVKSAIAPLSHPSDGSYGTGWKGQTNPPDHLATMGISSRLAASQPALNVPTSITSVDSLHPIDLPEAQLAKLGIVLEDNGDIDFYTKEGKKIIKLGLPPSWGIRLNIGKKNSENDTSGISIPTLPPRLITEPDGSKRLFTFESDTAYTKNEGGQIMQVQAQNWMRIAPDKNSDDARPSGSSKDIHGIIHSNQRVSVELGDSGITPAIKKEMVAVNMDSIMAGLNVDSLIASVNIDSIIKSAGPELHGKNMDSVMQAARIAMRQVKRIISSMRVHVDTGRSKSDLKIEVNATEDSDEVIRSGAVSNGSITNVQVDSGQIANISLNGKSIRLGHTINDVNIPVPSLENIMRQIASPDLSRLIPIRVVNHKNPDHPNELIFWYDPTPELQAALPTPEAVVAVPNVKHVDVSVFPNPTPGPATLHFDIAGANSAQYSIRNLLGQEVMSGGTLSGSTGDLPLDLSKLDAGVYLLVTTTNGGLPDVERVVVAK